MSAVIQRRRTTDSMRDLFILGCLVALVLLSFRRPWLMTLAYIYVDLFQPQRVGYYLLSSVPVSLIFALGAVLFWMVGDRDKRGIRFTGIQAQMLLFLVWITITTAMSMLPEHAWIKWDSAWKAIAFGVFIPFVLRTRRRIEGALFTVVLCVGMLTISGGVKTALGGGGYGTLKTFVDNNSGLYEGSTLATVSIAVIPLILYLVKNATWVGFPKLAKLGAAGLIVSALLIPIGTEARTGLVCIAALAFLLFISAKRKLMLAAGFSLAALVAIPFLPQSFTERMGTIRTHDEEQSASTRLAVWGWTLDFVSDHPLGGGFGVYRLNSLEVQTRVVEGPENAERVRTVTVVQRARAFHSSYFEVLGEHGYPGLLIFLIMVGTAVLGTWRIYRRYRANAEERWVADMAKALGMTLIIYLVGATFVGIAFQTTLYLLLGLTASVLSLAATREKSLDRQVAPAFVAKGPVGRAVAWRQAC